MEDTFDVNKFFESWMSIPVDEWTAQVDEWVYQFREVKPGGRSNQVRRGGVQSSQARLETSDKIKAQFCAARPIADGSVIEIISDNWVKFGLLRTYGIQHIRPGTDAKIELYLEEKMSVQLRQRFAIRQGTTIVGRGVFIQSLPPQTEEEKKRISSCSLQQKRLMEAKMAKLKVSTCEIPTEKQGEPGCSHSKSDNDQPTAKTSKDTENK